MKKLYVVGNKVSKSLSPTIFNYWFKKYNIKASYGYLELTEKNFHKKIKNAAGLGSHFGSVFLPPSGPTPSRHSTEGSPRAHPGDPNTS